MGVSQEWREAKKTLYPLGFNRMDIEIDFERIKKEDAWWWLSKIIRILRERPRPLGRGCRAHRAKRGHSGARCCSIYWRNTSIGAPPHEAAK